MLRPVESPSFPASVETTDSLFECREVQELPLPLMVVEGLRSSPEPLPFCDSCRLSVFLSLPILRPKNDLLVDDCLAFLSVEEVGIVVHQVFTARAHPTYQHFRPAVARTPPLSQLSTWIQNLVQHPECCQCCSSIATQQANK